MQALATSERSVGSRSIRSTPASSRDMSSRFRISSSSRSLSLSMISRNSRDSSGLRTSPCSIRVVAYPLIDASVLRGLQVLVRPRPVVAERGGAPLLAGLERPLGPLQLDHPDAAFLQHHRDG